MSGIKQATFGAGCFWGAEAAFRALPGVVDTRVGYAVEAGDESLRIEVVQVDFDPQVLAYSRLIEHFWGLHDPTSVDRQGEHGGGNIVRRSSTPTRYRPNRHGRPRRPCKAPAVSTNLWPRWWCRWGGLSWRMKRISGIWRRMG
ncbi:Peptide methionine sulfoxide reductase MsrA [Pseudomonas chlororaphis subsp. aurantiaca]|nr:Peptide methionine sulfoxide reductase MsrA [Pseudomonas chlororaphis subsp. aurantiaca]